MDEFAFRGGTAGHDAHDCCIAVFGTEHSTNAGELHVDAVDIEVFCFDRAHVIGVRIEGVGEGAEISFELIAIVVFLHGLQ